MGLSFAAATTSGEISALTDLYYSCDGDNWENNTNWLHGDPCDVNLPWYGIVCSNSHVVGLNLPENSLYGTVPATLDNLYSLTSISLFNNDIFGLIPSNWNQLRSLQKIDLHGNSFTKSIPDSLGDLLDFNLYYLDLSENQLTGEIPDFFNGATQFTYVDLSNNAFACPIPSWAEYTKANCIQVTILSTQPLCIEDIRPFLVFGENFGALGEVNCTLTDLNSGAVVSETPALVLGENALQCIGFRNFEKCTGSVGNRMFEMNVVSLTRDGKTISGNSSVEIGIINPYCIPGTSLPGYAIVPSAWVIEDMCLTGNPTPWSCPYSVPATSPAIIIEPQLVPSCQASESNTCAWAPGHTGQQYSCVFQQCHTSSHTCSYVTTGCLTRSGYSSTCSAECNNCP